MLWNVVGTVAVVVPSSISPVDWSVIVAALIIVKLEAKRIIAIVIAVTVSPLAVDDLETNKGEDTLIMPIK